MEKDLYLCNECDNLHADETHYCEACGCDSIRIVPESELQGEKMEWKEEGCDYHWNLKLKKQIFNC